MTVYIKIFWACWKPTNDNCVIWSSSLKRRKGKKAIKRFMRFCKEHSFWAYWSKGNNKTAFSLWYSTRGYNTNTYNAW